MDQGCAHIVRHRTNGGEYVADACGKSAKFIVEREFSGLTSPVCGVHVAATRLRALGVRVQPLSGTPLTAGDDSAAAVVLPLGGRR